MQLLTPTQRDRRRRVLHVLTGVLSTATAAAVGATTALIANADHEADVRKAEAKAQARHDQLVAWAASHPVVQTVQRPQRTVVGKPTIRKVVVVRTVQVGGGGARVAAAGSASARSSTAGSYAPSGGSVVRSGGVTLPQASTPRASAPRPAAPATAPAPAPAPAPPPPPPVTSTGS